MSFLLVQTLSFPVLALLLINQKPSLPALTSLRQHLSQPLSALWAPLLVDKHDGPAATLFEHRPAQVRGGRGGGMCAGGVLAARAACGSVPMQALCPCKLCAHASSVHMQALCTCKLCAHTDGPARPGCRRSRRRLCALASVWHVTSCMRYRYWGCMLLHCASFGCA